MFAEEEARFTEERERQKRRESFSLVDDLPFIEDSTVEVEEVPLYEDVSVTESAAMPIESETESVVSSPAEPEVETEVQATAPVMEPEHEISLPFAEEFESANYES